jgi:phosphoadenosine phosphosulfate reductase
MLNTVERFPYRTPENLDRLYGDLAAEDLLAAAVYDLFPGRIALVSSFGADSILLLHMVSRVDRTLPVLFLDTGKHFWETRRYRDEVAETLGLTNVIDLHPAAAELAAADPAGTLHATNPDLCCAMRKVRPLGDALKGYDAWITGRRREQTFIRGGMKTIERDGPRVKFNPLASWSQDEVDAYIDGHELPRNPLVFMGYPSIGCEPCTAPVAPGEDSRAGRWRGLAKTECGIHLAA